MTTLWREESDLNAKYDRHADVLYLAAGIPVPAYVDEDENGLAVRFALSDDHPCGVTVIGYHNSGWNHQKAKLASLVAAHLNMKRASVIDVLNRMDCD